MNKKTEMYIKSERPLRFKPNEKSRRLNQPIVIQSAKYYIDNIIANLPENELWRVYETDSWLREKLRGNTKAKTPHNLKFKGRGIMPFFELGMVYIRQEAGDKATQHAINKIMGKRI